MPNRRAFSPFLLPVFCFKLDGKPEAFHSVLYQNTGHEYLPEMRAEMVQWFTRNLPPAAGAADAGK